VRVFAAYSLFHALALHAFPKDSEAHVVHLAPAPFMLWLVRGSSTHIV
jgi:hypothetical protein